jgi:hypothetical protein
MPSSAGDAQSWTSLDVGLNITGSWYTGSDQGA